MGNTNINYILTARFAAQYSSCRIDSEWGVNIF